MLFVGYVQLIHTLLGKWSCVQLKGSLETHALQHEFFEFNVQGSVHRKYLLYDIFPMRCNITQFIYFWKNALHFSGGISTHHQDHTQLYLQFLVLLKPLLLSATIVAGSSNSLTSIRYYKYNCVCSWWWVQIPPETCR